MTIKITRHTVLIERIEGESFKRERWYNEISASRPVGCVLIGCFYRDDDLHLVWRERWWAEILPWMLGVLVLIGVLVGLIWHRAHGG